MSEGKIESRRVRMTRRMIAESLLEMLESQPIDKLSIRALCERADINRSTFYKYYGSQYDVLTDIAHDTCSRLDAYLAEVGPDENGLMLYRILCFLQENRTLVGSLMENGAESLLISEIMRLPNIAATIHMDRSLNESQQLQYREFFISGAYHVISGWFARSCLEPADEIADVIELIYRRLS